MNNYGEPLADWERDLVRDMVDLTGFVPEDLETMAVLMRGGDSIDMAVQRIRKLKGFS